MTIKIYTELEWGIHPKQNKIDKELVFIFYEDLYSTHSTKHLSHFSILKD